MQAQSYNRNFVLQNEDFCISINRLYWAFEGRRLSQIIKNCPGQALHHYGSGQAQNKN